MCGVCSQMYQGAGAGPSGEAPPGAGPAGGAGAGPRVEEVD